MHTDRQVHVQAEVQHMEAYTYYGRNDTGLCLLELVISHWSFALV